MIQLIIGMIIGAVITIIVVYKYYFIDIVASIIAYIAVIGMIILSSKKKVRLLRIRLNRKRVEPLNPIFTKIANSIIKMRLKTLEASLLLKVKI